MNVVIAQIKAAHHERRAPAKAGLTYLTLSSRRAAEVLGAFAPTVLGIRVARCYVATTYPAGGEVVHFQSPADAAHA